MAFQQLNLHSKFGRTKKIPPVTPHDKSLMVEFEALIEAFN